MKGGESNMNKRVIISLTTIGLALASSAMGVAAYFTSSVSASNNTFATGSLQLRLFYDCRTPNNQGDVVEETFGPSNDFAIVECPIDGNGADEREQASTDSEALKYALDDNATFGLIDGGDIYNLEALATRWTPANGWWAGLSSPMDHTMVYPGWSRRTNPDGYQQSDLLSVGNAGSLPLDLYLTMNYEAYDLSEIVEPLDGLLSNPLGGDRIDPQNDVQWNLTKSYNVALANRIELRIERVDNHGFVVGTSTYTGSFASLMNTPLQLDQLEPNEVAFVRFNWRWLDGENDNEFQNTFFDYSIKFDGTQVGAPAPVAGAAVTPGIVAVGAGQPAP